MDNIVADSTFYICFLDDINLPDYLSRILEKFTAHLSPKILEEISKSKNSHYILDNKKLLINKFEKTNLILGEALKPLFSIEQKNKGEHEIIVLAYVCYNMKIDFILVVDEESTRRFIQRNFPYLCNNLTNTIYFIGDCHCKYLIFKKVETIRVLDMIKNSKFRVPEQIIIETKEIVEKSKNE